MPGTNAPTPTEPPAGRRWGRSRSLRAAGGLAQWALPVATLALAPKCPLCVAGYVLLFTGVGISFRQAAGLRWAMIAVSLAALALLGLRTARRALRRFASGWSSAAGSSDHARAGSA